MSRFALIFVALFCLIAAPALASGTLQVGVSGPGTVTGTGINCVRAVNAAGTTGDCTEYFEDKKVCVLVDGKLECELVAQGTALKATPAGSGFVFDGWSGDCTSRTCSVALDGDLSVTANFRDEAPPSVALSGIASGAVLRGSVTLSATASDNASVSRVVFAIGGTTIVDEQPPYVATLNIAGMKDLVTTASAEATDTSGLKSKSSVNVTVDNSAPVVKLGGPNGTTSGPGSVQSWTWDVADSTPVSVTCSVVPVGTPTAFGACAGKDAHSVSGKSNGRWVFSLRATDSAGNVTDVGREFAIDTVAPVTSVVAGVVDGATTTDTSLAWAFGASEDDVTYACRVYPAALTPGTFAPCSEPAGHVAAGFAPGVYAFEVRATDAVGNVETAPVKRTFTVEAGPPPVVVATPQPTPDTSGPSVPVVGGGGDVPHLSAAGAKSADAAPQIVVTLAFRFSSATKTSTKLTSLVVKGVPAGATVTAPGFKKTNASGDVSLKPLTKKPLRARTKLVVTISKPGMTTAIKTLTIRPRKSPLVSTSCQAPGVAKPKPC